MADKLNKEQREAREQRAKALRAAARWWEGCSDGKDNDHAARLRHEVRTMPDNSDFADMDKERKRYKYIANTVTAESEAYHEKQVRAQRSPKRVIKKPWYKDADPILNKLHTENPGWKTGRLRRELENRWELEPGRPKLPEPRAVEKHIEKLLNQGNLAGEAK